VNHEKVVGTLAKALAEIAEKLPTVELQSSLYPTARMREAVTNLYAVILRFLIRARDWYEEGRLKHFVHSITRPVELRYQDLLGQITDSTRMIEHLARVGHQAESRDMHTNIQIKLDQVHADVRNSVHRTSGHMYERVDQIVADLHRKLDSASDDIHRRLAETSTTVEMIHNTVTCK
jgi:hypothetical protein